MLNTIQVRGDRHTYLFLGMALLLIIHLNAATISGALPPSPYPTPAPGAIIPTFSKMSYSNGFTDNNAAWTITSRSGGLNPNENFERSFIKPITLKGEMMDGANSISAIVEIPGSTKCWGFGQEGIPGDPGSLKYRWSMSFPNIKITKFKATGTTTETQDIYVQAIYTKGVTALWVLSSPLAKPQWDFVIEGYVNPVE